MLMGIGFMGRICGKRGLFLRICEILDRGNV